MSDIAIRVEHLSKRYRIRQGTRPRYDTLRDALSHAVRAPFRSLGAVFQRADGGRPTADGSLLPAVLGRPLADGSNDEFIWALKDVSFEVKRGEVVGIIGRNGAGKTTLLKVLSRITEPTEGYAEVRGRVGSLLEVGTGFHPELTGRENIYLNGAILGMRKAEINRKFDEIVAFAEIEKFLDTPVKFYSSGMYVRLAFAVAAHLDPEILLVDEVLAVGDAAFQKKCLGKMGEVAAGGRTVLFVSHNMGSIRSLCRSAIELEYGLVKNSGYVDDIVDGYIARLLEPEARKLAGRYVRKVTVLDTTRGKAGLVDTGCEAVFLVEFDTGNTFLLDVAVTIGIYTATGYRVTALSTTYATPGGRFKRLQGKGHIECRVGSLPLVPGEYFLNVAFQGFAGGTEAVRDHVAGAASFRVTDAGLSGTLDPNAIAKSFVLLRQEWSLQDAEFRL